MCGHDDFFCRDTAVSGFRHAVLNALHKCVLINRQLLCELCDQLERVALRLMRKTDRPFGWKRKRQVFRKLRRKSQSIDRLYLPLDARSVPQRIDKRAFFLKIEIILFTQRPVFLQCALIGLQISCRVCFSFGTEQTVINQSMLRGNLRRCVFRRAAGDFFRLHQQAVHTGSVQLIRTQNTAESSADHQYIRADVSLQCIVRFHRNTFRPNTFSHIISLRKQNPIR